VQKLRHRVCKTNGVSSVDSQPQTPKTKSQRPNSKDQVFKKTKHNHSASWLTTHARHIASTVPIRPSSTTLSRPLVPSFLLSPTSQQSSSSPPLLLMFRQPNPQPQDTTTSAHTSTFDTHHVLTALESSHCEPVRARGYS
jgi:hypothetical protein